MKGGTRPGAGRKPRPDDKMIRVSVSLTPKQYEWLKAQPGGMGDMVRYLILVGMRMEKEAMERAIDNGFGMKTYER